MACRTRALSPKSEGRGAAEFGTQRKAAWRSARQRTPGVWFRSVQGARCRTPVPLPSPTGARTERPTAPGRRGEERRRAGQGRAGWACARGALRRRMVGGRVGRARSGQGRVMGGSGPGPRGRRRAMHDRADGSPRPGPSGGIERGAREKPPERDGTASGSAGAGGTPGGAGRGVRTRPSPPRHGPQAASGAGARGPHPPGGPRPVRRCEPRGRKPASIAAWVRGTDNPPPPTPPRRKPPLPSRESTRRRAGAQPSLAAARLLCASAPPFPG